MAREPDYYEVLEVSPDASREEIKASYRRAVRVHHPDAALPKDKGAAHARIQLIFAAWTALSDDTSRTAYDERRRRAAVERANAATDVEEAHERGEIGVPRFGRDAGGASGGIGAPRGGAPSVDTRKRSRVQAVMGAGQPPRSANPRTKLLTMVFEAAQLYHVEGRADEAARVCQSVLRADPTNAEAAVLLADIYTAQNKRSAALDLLERALRLQPSNALYRSKWEALRHSAGSPAPSSSSPTSTSARSGPNPWSRAAEPSPLASRISRRPDETASTSADSVPLDPLDEAEEEKEAAPSGNVADVKAHDVHPSEAPEPAPSSVPPVSSDLLDAAPPRGSFLQRLRSKLSR